jgi:predicted RND superfamily exporter protein
MCVAMKPTFFARRALLILCVIFFLVPFALRGSRMSLERMENNVKDWLPDSFAETRELTWFAKHFVGEQSFVLLTWDGCTDADESYRLYVDKLRKEIAPDELVTEIPPLEPDDPKLAGLNPDQQRAVEREHEVMRARAKGDELGLFTTGNYFENWGGRGEKWLKAADQSWYFVTPNGELYSWAGRSNVLGLMSRMFSRHVLRKKVVDGKLVETFGRPPGKENKNDFHDDPRLLTARVLKSVQTGPEVLAELSAPGGSMWPIGPQYSEEERHQLARRRALDRLKGGLFGPEAIESFTWTTDDFERVLRDKTKAELPEDWQTTFDAYVTELVENKFHGDRHKLLNASLLTREQHWNGLFERLGIDPPGIQTAIMVTLSKSGTVDLRRVIGRGLLGKPRGKLVDLAIESGILPPAKPPMAPFAKAAAVSGRVLRMGGPPVDNVAIDEEGQITLVRLVGFSILLGLGLSYFCFRSVKVTIMVFMVGGISAVASLSIVWWTGESVDAILMSMPSLVYVLGLSGAVHIVNYYREAVREDGLIGAPERALKHGLLPCTLAAFTTSLGLLSLCQSNIYPIRKFGFFSAIGVLATVILLFTYLPSALQLWPPGYQKERRSRDSDSPSGLAHLIHNFWQRFGGWIVNHHWQVVTVCGIVFVVVGFGLTKLDTSIQLLKLFDKDAKIIRDYRWLEANVGRLVPMELVVSVDKDSQYPTAEQRLGMPDPTPEQRTQENYQFSFLERVEIIDHVQQAVEAAFGPRGRDIVGNALSAATFAPPILDPIDSQRATINTKLEQNRERLLSENYLDIDDDESELWRISVRLGALNDVDYGKFVAQLKRVVEPVLTAYQYRDRILRAIQEQRGDATGVNVWNGTRIAMLGASDPRAVASDEEQAQDEVNRAALTPHDPVSAEDVSGIFSTTLGNLLRGKGYQGAKGRQIPKRYMVWNDPVKTPMPAGYSTSDNWAANLAKFDCVVLLRDHPDYDVDFIQQHAKAVIDARDFTFDPEADATAKQKNLPIQVTYTGVVPIVYKAQATLLRSLIDSIGWAFVMIAAVMMFLLRSKRTRPLNVPGGLLSMVPNVFPVVLIFGAMGHLKVKVDIGTMMTASVAMGVAVDDTIHFLTWFRDGIRQGMERKEAIKEAYGRVALAMTQTTLIGGLGLSVFALSTFTPTQRFGTMMLTLLIAALVGDLVLLPAILAGPMGKYFCPKPTKRRSPDDEAHNPEPPEPKEQERSVLPLEGTSKAEAKHSALRGRSKSGQAKRLKG